MIKTYTLAITIAFVGTFTVAVTDRWVAAPRPLSNAAVPITATDVKYRADAVQFWDYSANLDSAADRQGHEPSSELFCYLWSEPCNHSLQVTN